MNEHSNERRMFIKRMGTAAGFAAGTVFSSGSGVAAEGGDMEFCTVNPSLVLGPLQSGDFSTSLEAIKKLLEGSLPGLPNFGFGVVDVRDVAQMHVQSIKSDVTKGERILAASDWLSLV